MMPWISFAQQDTCNMAGKAKIIAIPASEKSINALMDQNFSRCSFFCFYNTKTGETTFTENPYKATSGAASKLVIQFLVENKVNEIYAVQLGQNAKMHLDRYKISVKIIDSGKTINQIISIIKNK
jgi:predicted Fe-Mo cluster-binding NifX family protein